MYVSIPIPPFDMDTDDPSTIFASQKTRIKGKKRRGLFCPRQDKPLSAPRGDQGPKGAKKGEQSKKEN
jgi:hypothetical protein